MSRYNHLIGSNGLIDFSGVAGKLDNMTNAGIKKTNIVAVTGVNAVSDNKKKGRGLKTALPGVDINTTSSGSNLTDDGADDLDGADFKDANSGESRDYKDYTESKHQKLEREKIGKRINQEFERINQELRSRR